MRMSLRVWLFLVLVVATASSYSHKIQYVGGENVNYPEPYVLTEVHTYRFAGFRVTVNGDSCVMRATRCGETYYPESALTLDENGLYLE